MRLPLFILFLCAAQIIWAQAGRGNTWEEVKKNGRGEISIYWHESRPFIWKDDNTLKGIEYDLIIEFVKFLKENYNAHLTINWIEASSFAETYQIIKQQKTSGIFGVSAFSITPERKSEVNFSSPYMLDISVLISSKNVPVIKEVDQLDKILSGLTAITIKGTTYESDLLALKKDRHVDFKINYIPSIKNILNTIQDTTSAFGFIDLPVYLMYLNKGSLEVNRQNLYPIKREGYAFIYPKSSDWEEPLIAFFQSESFHQTIKPIISNYIDQQVYDFIENLFKEADDHVMLLTHEKEVQLQELKGKTKQIEVETKLRNYLIIALTLILFSLVVIIIFYIKRNKTNQKLLEQKAKIEKQRISIENQNHELEERNKKLLHLNEEKNYLIKVLAHDLRAPINQVQGLAEIFLAENKNLPDDKLELIKRIIDSAQRQNKMIGKILDIDAVESNRVNLSLEKIDLHNLLEKVVRDFKIKAALKNIRIAYEDKYQNYFVHADVVYLTEIIENILSNALKFSPQGKTISITLNDLETSIKICVKDEGPGLTEEDKQKLFLKNQQLSAKATDGEPSTGLGLSIVKKYTELMNGKVWAESTLGNGAKFCIELPKQPV
jgi:signal transduction histidine kinase